ncbi:MAG: oligosaccharide repeat unit polymerase [Candidatus Doudnabacteria bacterium]|nr:oligosaccharide repeat unit polymerase [Candidatus Doudnabacteria bacterium]
MELFLFTIFFCLSVAFFVVFLKGPYKFSPIWLMLSAWMAAIGIPRLHLSRIEVDWTGRFIFLIALSLNMFILGFWAGKKFFGKYPIWNKLSVLVRSAVSVKALRISIYVLFLLSVYGLYKFYITASTFPLLAESPDVFRFAADEKVPGLINYLAQLARVFVPLSFFLIFYEKFSFKKHWDLGMLALIGAVALTLFASRTQIYMIDLWIMALYLFMRKPNFKQALKFYPAFLAVSVAVLVAIPILRQNKSYGENYLGTITEINYEKVPKGFGVFLPIYVGISFNMQALMSADTYYQTHALQYGKVTLDPFTNMLGLDSLKSNFDLGAIFKSWWNTGTYLFPFVQDFGVYAFVFVPFIFGFLITMLWQYFINSPNFLSVNLYAYACFFIVMTVYLSFTVRAEMYIDLFVLGILYLVCSRYEDYKNIQSVKELGIRN